jgi:D-amino peptidase
VPVPEIARPGFLQLDLQTADLAEVATWVPGVEGVGERTIGIRDDDLLALYSTFVAVTYITRQASGR